MAHRKCSVGIVTKTFYTSPFCKGRTLLAPPPSHFVAPVIDDWSLIGDEQKFCLTYSSPQCLVQLVLGTDRHQSQSQQPPEHRQQHPQQCMTPGWSQPLK